MTTAAPADGEGAVDVPAADVLFREVLEPALHNAPSGEDHLRYTLACRLRDRGADEDTALNLMRGWNILCDYPRDDAEIEKAVRNAYRYARDVPGNGGLEERPPPPPEEALAALMQAEEERPTPVPARPKLRVRGIGELMDAPPTRWLVKDWIPAEGLTVIYGPPKAGKTFVALDLMHAIACGGRTKWLGEEHGPPLDPDARGRAVVLLALEAEAVLGPRLKALAVRYSDVDPDGERFLTNAVWVGREAGKFETLLKDLPEALREAGVESPAAVIVDTYARLMVLNGSDENDTLAQGQAAEVLERLAETLKTAVITIAHSGKDAERGVRGSSALVAAADAVIRMNPAADEQPAEMIMEASRCGPQGMRLPIAPGCPVAIDDRGEVMVPTWEAVSPQAAADARPKAVQETEAALHDLAQSAVRGAAQPEISLVGLKRNVISTWHGSGDPPGAADVLKAVRWIAARYPPDSIVVSPDGNRVFIQAERVLQHGDKWA